jgi:hypothetical protein
MTSLLSTYFLDALRQARHMGNPSLTTIPLAGMVRWHAATGADEKAIELGTFLTRMSATWQETRDQVRQIMIASASRLSTEQLAAAQERGRDKDLDAVLGEVLEPESRADR